MIVVSAKDLTKAYGTDIILDRVSFHINKGDRVGIIGVNGAGKTTLLRMLTGEIPCEDGEFFISGNLRTGYLKQDTGFESENTLMEEVNRVFAHFPEMEEEMERLLKEAGEDPDRSSEKLERYQLIHDQYEWMGGYSYQSEIRGILSSMGFDESTYDKKIAAFSGGERTRLALALLLLEKPDILFLDEPTNHLDIGTLRWLEQYLKGYRGTIILVSHDRYFLDQTVTRIFEIENRRLNIYEGGYSFYATERRARREAELRLYEKQQKEIARQEDMIRRFKQRGTEKLAKRAASREKRLEQMERIDRPDGSAGKMKISFHQEYQSGRDVIHAEDLSKSFGYGSRRKDLFSGISLDVRRGERVCVVGDNGTGKTTLLRILMGDLEASGGRVRIGHNVLFGYYDQGQLLLNPANTVIGELQDAYHLYTEGELRNILGRFLFRGEQVFLTVGSLSGGEKARLALLKLMMSGANVLVLDEPTNHLDIESKEVFEDALLDFPGTCVIVSHDRYFLNRIPTRILELSSDGLAEYLGGYDYYVEKKQRQEQETASGRNPALAGQRGAGSVLDGNGEIRNEDEPALDSAARRKLQKEKEAEERRLRRKREALEQSIGELEAELKEIEEQLALPEVMTDPARLEELGGRMESRRAELDETYEKWLELNE